MNFRLYISDQSYPSINACLFVHFGPVKNSGSKFILNSSFVVATLELELLHIETGTLYILICICRHPDFFPDYCLFPKVTGLCLGLTDQLQETQADLTLGLNSYILRCILIRYILNPNYFVACFLFEVYRKNSWGIDYEARSRGRSAPDSLAF